MTNDDSTTTERPDSADPDTADPDTAGGATELGYGAALTEIESILDDLETSTVDVDHLAEQVRRAALLIAYCRDRLSVVEADVAEVVEGLDRGTDPATARSHDEETA